MNRKKAATIIEKELSNVMSPCFGEEFYEALYMAERSLRLWDNFIERLAEKCNNATTQNEWNTYRKAIELIKVEFDEKIE